MEDTIVIRIPIPWEEYKKLWEIAGRNDTTPAMAAWAILKLALDDDKSMS